MVINKNSLKMYNFKSHYDFNFKYILFEKFKLDRRHVNSFILIIKKIVR